MSKVKKIILVLLILSLAVLGGLIVYAKNLLKTDNIHKNIFVGSVDVSGLSKEQAKQAVSDVYKYGILTLTDGSNTFTQDLSQSGFEFEIDKAIDEAYSIGRSDSFIENVKTVIAKNSGIKEKIEIQKKEDFEKLNELYTAIENTINKNPIDASVYINNGNISISNEQAGQRANIEKLKEDIKIMLAANNVNPTVDIEIQVVEPTIRQENLKSINGVISSYSSNYNVNEVDRSFNVTLTSQKIDNQLLMPGQEVSFMNRLGNVSVDAGFKKSRIIVNNEYQDGIGGGVCQVSSTLYNALIMSGVGITSRTNHSFPIGYIPTGRDATVANNGPDLIYKNNYDFPVVIKTYAYGGTMIAQVYGDTTRANKFEIESKITKTIEPNVIYKNDPTIPLGKEVVEDKGHIGYTTETYKISNGQSILVSRDNYVMTPKIIKTGTGAPEVDVKKDSVLTVVSPDKATNPPISDVVF